MPPANVHKPFIRYFLTPIYSGEGPLPHKPDPSDMMDDPRLPWPDPNFTSTTIDTLPSFYNGLK